MQLFDQHRPYLMQKTGQFLSRKDFRQPLWAALEKVMEKLVKGGRSLIATDTKPTGNGERI